MTTKEKLTVYQFQTGATQHLYHLCKKQDDGTWLITGWCINLAKGALLSLAQGTFEVQSIQYRDHKGEFANPKKNINSFFTAICRQMEDKELDNIKAAFAKGEAEYHTGWDWN